MPLINCPDCETIVSDQAFQCPKCAYPISNLRNTTRQPEAETVVKENVTVNVQSSDLNLSSMLLLAERKNESTAVLLVLIFGPIGLVYANTEKAIRLIVTMVISFIVVIYITDGNEESYWSLIVVMTVIFWIISLVQAVDSVKLHNSNLLENQRTPQKGRIDEIDQLRLLIKNEKELAFYAPSKSEEIINSINKLCTDRDSTIKLLDSYNERYETSIIDDLSQLTAEKQKLSSYLEPFVKYGMVEEGNS